MFALTAKLAGRRYHPGKIEPTSVIELIRDRLNAADRSAVQVRADETVVGYLEAGLAYLIAPLLDRGRPIFAAAIKGNQKSISLFAPDRFDALGRSLKRSPLLMADGAMLLIQKIACALVRRVAFCCVGTSERFFQRKIRMAANREPKAAFKFPRPNPADWRPSE